MLIVNEILQLAELNQVKAWEVIKEARIFNAWESIGAEVNLIGSLKTGLLISNLDIDFHIYTSPFKQKDSFLAMATLAENPRIKRINLKNLLDTPEKCLEWHAWYQVHTGETWRIDMIHFHPGSPYVGRFEIVADRILAVLTNETREAILSIKHSAALLEPRIKGIEITMAVIRDGISTYDDFIEWRKNQVFPEIIAWIP